MKLSTIDQLSWQDVQDIWIVSNQVLHVLDTDPAKHPSWTSSTANIFTEVLRRLKEKAK